MRRVGDFIVETLIAHGVDRLFCVPGESYLCLLDALHDRPEIDTVVCRHEGGAGFMALADARLTGRPGVVCVSRGPGACNAAIAVHTAQQDATPLILIVGQVAAGDLRRDAFQEIDYGKMFGGIAKWTAEIADPARAPETLLRAFRIATGGTPGPVVIAVPEDILTAGSDAPGLAPQRSPRAAPAQGDVAALRRWLENAERPLLLAGSALESDMGRAALLRFAERWRVPVAVSFRRQDLFPNDHPLYAGAMQLANPPAQMAVMAEAEPLLVVGARLGDITTQGYAFPELVRPRRRLAHIHPDANAIGTHFATDLGIISDAPEALDAIGEPDARLPDRSGWIGRLAEQRRALADRRAPEPTDGLAFDRVVAALGRQLPDNAIVTLDAGAFGAPAYRAIPFRPPQRMLAPISGAMGYGVPAAVAAGLRHPGRPVVCLVGDGGLLMTGAELAVARERRLPLKVIVSENGAYGSIRLHQERLYPGRVAGTGFVNPDIEALGRAFGLEATRFERPEDLEGMREILARDTAQMIVVSSSLSAASGG